MRLEGTDIQHQVSAGLILQHACPTKHVERRGDSLAWRRRHLTDFLLGEIGRDFHQMTGPMAYLSRQADQHFDKSISGVVYGQAVDLRIRLFQRSAENIDKYRDQVRFAGQESHDFLKRHADRLGLFQCYRAVGTHLLGGTKFPNDVAAFSHVVNHFAPICRYCSDPWKAVLQEEERPFAIAHVVNHRMLAESRRFAVWKNEIAKLSTKDRRQGSGNGCLIITRIIELKRQVGVLGERWLHKP